MNKLYGISELWEASTTEYLRWNFLRDALSVFWIIDIYVYAYTYV